MSWDIGECVYGEGDIVEGMVETPGFLITDEKGYHIAIVMGPDEGYTVRGEGAANARLIACAPELARLLAFPPTPGAQEPMLHPLLRAQDRLSEALEDEDAENDDIRDLAIDLVAELNAFHEQREALRKKVEGLT